MARKVQEDREPAKQQSPAEQGQDLAVLPTADTPQAPETPEAALAPQPTQPSEGKKPKDLEPLETDKLGWKKLPKLDELKVGDMRLTSYYHEALKGIWNAILTGQVDGLPDFSQSDIVGLNVEGSPGKMMYQNLRTAVQDVMDLQRSLRADRNRKPRNSHRNHRR